MFAFAPRSCLKVEYPRLHPRAKDAVCDKRNLDYDHSQTTTSDLLSLSILHRPIATLVIPRLHVRQRSKPAQQKTCSRSHSMEPNPPQPQKTKPPPVKKNGTWKPTRLRVIEAFPDHHMVRYVHRPMQNNMKMSVKSQSSLQPRLAQTLI